MYMYIFCESVLCIVLEIGGYKVSYHVCCLRKLVIHEISSFCCESWSTRDGKFAQKF